MRGRWKYLVYVTGAGLMLVAGLTWGASHIASSGLHHAVAVGDSARLSWLLQLGGDVNAVNKLRATPLHIAARSMPRG